MQEYITISDYLLLPLYLLLFYLIVRIKSKKYKALGLQKTFIAAFWVRMAGAISYSLLIQYYYGYGDSFGYFGGGNVICRMINQDITSLKYLFFSAKEVVAAANAMGFGDEIPVTMPNDSNLMVMKISAIISFFTFGKYLLIAICFGFFSFIGIWKLFFAFYHLNKKMQVKLLAFFVLFFPSLWFWGSGLLKEPLCVGALGIIIYLFYKNFIEGKISWFDIVVILIMLFILTMVKSYITIILLVSFLILLIFKGIQKIRNKLFRYVTITLVLFLVSITLISLDVSSYITYFLNNSLDRIQQLQTSYQLVEEMEEVGSKGTFKISDFDASFESVLGQAPVVIGTCLFRPFVWESKKIIIFFTSLEALFALLVTLYILIITKVYYFFKYTFTTPLLLFCFIFSILFAAVIGYTTFNFGTMVRYKIIFLPFYFFMLIQIYRIHKEYQRV